MKCFVGILRLEKECAIVAIDGVTWGLPLSILPEHSRPGDILQLEISFCPYKTLALHAK